MAAKDGQESGCRLPIVDCRRVATTSPCPSRPCTSAPLPLTLHQPRAPTCSQAVSVSPLAVVHTLGNTLTNISLGAVAVSFTHTIKALEPMFSGGWARGQLDEGRQLGS